MGEDRVVGPWCTPPCVWRVASQAFLRRKCLCTKTFLTRHRQGKKWRVASKSPKKVSAPKELSVLAFER
jgi:hypothetical protein